MSTLVESSINYNLIELTEITFKEQVFFLDHFIMLTLKTDKDVNINQYHSELITAKNYTKKQDISVNINDHSLTDDDSKILVDIYMFILIPSDNIELKLYKSTLMELLKQKIGTDKFLSDIPGNIDFPDSQQVPYLSKDNIVCIQNLTQITKDVPNLLAGVDETTMFSSDGTDIVNVDTFVFQVLGRLTITGKNIGSIHGTPRAAGDNAWKLHVQLPETGTEVAITSKVTTFEPEWFDSYNNLTIKITAPQSGDYKNGGEPMESSLKISGETAKVQTETVPSSIVRKKTWTQTWRNIDITKNYLWTLENDD